MKKLTKWKRKLSKKWEACKSFLQDQLFYLKKFSLKLLQVGFNTLVFLTQVTLITVLFVVIFLFAERAHEKYIEHKVGSQVVFIRSMPDSPLQGSATGFQIVAKSGKTFILTNAHVCALRNNDNMLKVQEKSNTGRFIPRRVVEVYEANDLCLVEGLEGYEGLKLGKAPQVSDKLVTIGYPLGQGMHISSGRIKAFAKVDIAVDIPIVQCKGDRLQILKINYFFFIQEVCLKRHNAVMTDILTYPGNSGSPAVDYLGNVVGIVFASDNTTHWGILVVFEDIKKLLDAY